ncbi:MAG: DUF3536 domain-containing protein [Synergistaceae bacterium]|jgi:alpha-amylase/alpha-mannosidase (GH57 family)|nr:DUF3536 domain-containing protein [Synergistaceae bacterium]
MPRYICVHGHFYQPPRENPWLEFVEAQESASPWHDWNDRVTAECYRRNTASRILDHQGNIRKICNNYSRMSFNIGPTLLSWLKENAPFSYQGILDADVKGMERFSGHGPALAQVYSHMIMPLANRRDKTTQVKWGIRDFESHFGRAPEGMWLAETAVDTETLDVLAENGIRFTILAPKQASAVRPLGKGIDKGMDKAWLDVKWEKIDTGMPYLCRLPSGRNITLFFYDGHLSQAIAFGGLLYDGGNYARHLIEAQPDGTSATLSHVATDGESYGHHHRNGDMALAYCLNTIDEAHEAELTIYGEFLENNPPTYEVRIVENSSWSCTHGVERWRNDCGCSNGTPGYHQKWRKPLRDALDWLRDKLAVLFEYEGAKYLKDPWEAREDYIQLILNRSPETVDQWIAAHASHPLTEEETVCVLKLMESQRSAILMYTSCGWFFDDISGLESTQILRYAARAIGLTHSLTGLDFNLKFERLLEKAPSNIPELMNGKRIYELLVKPSQISFERMAAHYGMLALFPDLISGLESDREGGISVGCWNMTGRVTREPVSSPNSQAFAAGEVEIVSSVTRERKSFILAANHRQKTSVICGVAPNSEETRKELLEDTKALREIFAASNNEKMVKNFDHKLFSLRHILHDARRALLAQLLRRDVALIEESLHTVVHDYDNLFEFLATLGVNAPDVIRSAAGIALTADIVHGLETNIPDIQGLRRNISLTKQRNVPLDNAQITVVLQKWTVERMTELHESPSNPAAIERLNDILAFFLGELAWNIDLYEIQNLYFAAQNKLRIQTSLQSPSLSPDVRASFQKLGKTLRFSDYFTRI